MSNTEDAQDNTIGQDDTDYNMQSILAPPNDDLVRLLKKDLRDDNNDIVDDYPLDDETVIDDASLKAYIESELKDSESLLKAYDDQSSLDGL